MAQGSAALAIQEEVRVMAQKVTMAEYWQLAKVNEAVENGTPTKGKAKEKAALKNRKVTDGKIEKTPRGNRNQNGPRQTKNGNQMNGSTEAHAQTTDMLIVQTNKNLEVHLEEAAKTRGTVSPAEKNIQTTRHNPVEAVRLQHPTTSVELKTEQVTKIEAGQEANNKAMNT